MSHDASTVIWSARPYAGIAWRPQDLSFSIMMLLVSGGGLFIGYISSWFFLVLLLIFTAYVLVGRFYHDAALRKQLRYELSDHGLAIWKDGRDTPECVFELFRLREVRVQFVTKSGRGTIELPPGGWATQPEWMNRWDRFVPAMYPCRRLELLDDVAAVAEVIRVHARKTLPVRRVFAAVAVSR